MKIIPLERKLQTSNTNPILPPDRIIVPEKQTRILSQKITEPERITVKSVAVQMTSTDPYVIKLEEENRQLKESKDRLLNQMSRNNDRMRESIEDSQKRFPPTKFPSTSNSIDINLKENPSSNPMYMKIMKEYNQVVELIDKIIESILTHLKMSNNVEMGKKVEDLVIPFLTHECYSHISGSKQNLAELLRTHLEKNLNIKIPFQGGLDEFAEIARFALQIRNSDPPIQWIAGKGAKYNTQYHDPANFKLEIKRITQPGLQVRDLVISKAKVEVKYTDDYTPKSDSDEIVRLKKELMELKAKKTIGLVHGGDTKIEVKNMMNQLRQSMYSIVDSFGSKFKNVDKPVIQKEKREFKKNLYKLLFNWIWDFIIDSNHFADQVEAKEYVANLDQSERANLDRDLTRRIRDQLILKTERKSEMEQVSGSETLGLVRQALNIVLENTKNDLELTIFFPQPGDEYITSEQEPHGSGLSDIVVSECLEPGLKLGHLVYLKASVILKLGE